MAGSELGSLVVADVFREIIVLKIRIITRFVHTVPF